MPIAATAAVAVLAGCAVLGSSSFGSSTTPPPVSDYSGAPAGRDVGTANASGDATSNEARCVLSLRLSGGSRAREYHTLAELAGDSTDIVIVENTETVPGRSPVSVRPGTTVRSADARMGPDGGVMGFVTVRVTRVLSGADLRAGQRIAALAFGSDEVTGHEALHDPGVYLLFLAPYVVGPNRPAGGYVVVGGPAGIFYRCALASDSAPFARADAESPDLPQEVLAADVPAAGWTTADYIAAGGRPGSR